MLDLKKGWFVCRPGKVPGRLCVMLEKSLVLCQPEAVRCYVSINREQSAPLSTYSDKVSVYIIIYVDLSLWLCRFQHLYCFLVLTTTLLLPTTFGYLLAHPIGSAMTYNLS